MKLWEIIVLVILSVFGLPILILFALFFLIWVVAEAFWWMFFWKPHDH